MYKSCGSYKWILIKLLANKSWINLFWHKKNDRKIDRCICDSRWAGEKVNCILNYIMIGCYATLCQRLCDKCISFVS